MCQICIPCIVKKENIKCAHLKSTFTWAVNVGSKCLYSIEAHLEEKPSVNNLISPGHMNKMVS